MKWVNISESFSDFGWKRLSDHEVDPKVSNGHEFQGVNALRIMLGIERRPEIPTDYYLIADDVSNKPAVIEVIPASASWYNSRENNKKRSAEWRLYYPAQAGRIQSLCKSGDLMIIGLRTNGKLAVFLIGQNSCAEAAFINLLQIPDDGRKQSHGTVALKAKDVDLGSAAAELIEDLALSFEGLGIPNVLPPIPLPRPDLTADDEVQRIAAKMFELWPNRLGACVQVDHLVASITGIGEAEIRANPDGTLVRWLDAAEGAYRIWEGMFLTGFISPIRNDASIPDDRLAEEISRIWMSLRQSRVSRAGTMLELFLCRIFDASALRYERGVSVEGGKLPDFVFPGSREYNDSSFPSSQLRILGAKTSLKERWRQILAEADRVEKKHAATRDISVTSQMFRQMREASFYVVIPEPLRRQYVAPPCNLINLSEFLNEVRETQRD